MTFTRQFPVADLLPYISWGYFFHAWSVCAEMASLAQVHNCPACMNAWLNQFQGEKREQAETAKSLLEDARILLGEWSNAGHHATCRVMVERAWSDGEDIILPDFDIRIPLLRQQHSDNGGPCLCLADFVAPKESGIEDRIGLFATCADPVLEQSFPDDPYRHLLAQTLADRLAEAAAELGHLLTRRQWWGYAPTENLSIRELLAAHYQGIRPAVGYPSLPDQSLNFVLAGLLNFEELGIRLTESGVMMPHASTSGLMLSHPRSTYFGVGKIGEDQLQDYAHRRGMTTDVLRPFLQGTVQ